MRLLDHRATLNASQRKQHLAHAFDVPAGINTLTINLTYTPQTIERVKGRNLLCITVFDPQGFRGASHNRAMENLVISPRFASDGYLMGVIDAGRWSVVIDTHMILEGAPLEYTLTVDAVDDLPDHVIPAPKIPPKPKKRGVGWYRGDLHAHSVHSDGRWAVADLVAYAQANALDFVSLTDHNTTSGIQSLHQWRSNTLLTVGGIELTTYYGHAVAWGIDTWVDWRVQPNKRTMADIQREVEALGGIFIIAHPLIMGDPVCTGCDWQYGDMMPGSAHFVEIWNAGLWYDYNERGLALWYRWLNDGHRIVATAGTDGHGAPTHELPLGYNVIYAHDLTPVDLMDGLKKGHVFLSNAPRLTFEALAKGRVLGMMGDQVTRKPQELVVRWQDCAVNTTLWFIADGDVVESIPLPPDGEHRWQIPSDSPHRWWLVELRDHDNRICAITNPIFSPDFGM